MASGFQNNQDQLTPTYYRVEINMTGYPTNAGYTGSNGAVEPFDFTNFATLNTSTNASRRRARGNVRFNSILNQLQLFDNVQILDVTNLTTVPADETAADHVAEKVRFTIGYTQEAYVFHGWQNLIGAGNFSNGSNNNFTTTYSVTYDQLSPADRAAAMVICIKEAVTRGVTIGGTSGYTRRYKTYDPDAKSHLEEDITVIQPDTPANVWAVLTVNIIDTMTQTTFGSP
jgi:hypothetical protein